MSVRSLGSATIIIPALINSLLTTLALKIGMGKSIVFVAIPFGVAVAVATLLVGLLFEVLDKHPQDTSYRSEEIFLSGTLVVFTIATLAGLIYGGWPFAVMAAIDVLLLLGTVISFSFADSDEWNKFGVWVRNFPKKFLGRRKKLKEEKKMAQEIELKEKAKENFGRQIKL